jgi:hypothetical protein
MSSSGHRSDQPRGCLGSIGMSTAKLSIEPSLSRSILQGLASELDRILFLLWLFLLWNVAPMALAALVLWLSWRWPKDGRATQRVLVATP